MIIERIDNNNKYTFTNMSTNKKVINTDDQVIINKDTIKDIISIVPIKYHFDKLINGYNKLGKLTKNISIIKCHDKIEENKRKFMKYYNKHNNNIVVELRGIIEKLEKEKEDIYIKTLIECAIYKEKNKDNNGMIKYLLIAVEKNNSEAMTLLGKHYENMKKYEEMMKYYKMAINNGNTYAMKLLGSYYQNSRQYDLMKQYYNMAINIGDNDAMNLMGIYYKIIEKNYEEMTKYFNMAIELGNYACMYNMATYYQSIKNYEEMKKYFNMAISHGDIDAMFRMGKYYETTDINYEQMKKYYNMAIINNNDNAKIAMSTYYNKSINQDIINDAIYTARISKYNVEEFKFINLVFKKRPIMWTFDRKLNYDSIKKYFSCKYIQKQLIFAKKNISFNIIFCKYDKIMTFLMSIKNKNIPKYIKIRLVCMLF